MPSGYWIKGSWVLERPSRALLVPGEGPECARVRWRFHPDGAPEGGLALTAQGPS